MLNHIPHRLIEVGYPAKLSDEETTTKIISAMVESAKILYNTKYTRDQYIDVLAKYAKRMMNES